MRLGVALGLVLTVLGCSWLPFTGPKRLSEVSVFVTTDVNGGYPVALDLVFVRNQKLFDQLSNMRAAEWFANRDDLRRQQPGAISVRSWEVVPGQQARNLPVGDDSRGSIGTLVFVDYTAGEGSYRASIKDRSSVRLILKKNDFEVVKE
ncbi:hypothetical protein [Variovorax saccharolyticus]|uniref:hypothetical protein n=1 Tax=Variovorax saccharolyticus TaxID=3053516 RepID=UPI0025780CE7|nr:hypothetical protein [Variovorax sp. J31P216]